MIEQQACQAVVDSPLGKIGIPYGIRTLPHLFLLDREGRITATFKSYRPGDEEKIKQQIEALIAIPQTETD